MGDGDCFNLRIGEPKSPIQVYNQHQGQLSLSSLEVGKSSTGLSGGARLPASGGR